MDIVRQKAGGYCKTEGGYEELGRIVRQEAGGYCKTDGGWIL